jgi:stage V sporulation protein AD
LLNQLIISNYFASNVNIPYLGIYNACASMCEQFFIASSLIDTGKIDNAVCLTSSDNVTSERQYRNPVEYGAPKKEYQTFTVTGSTSCFLSKNKSKIKVESSTIGKVIDKGIKDVNDMGSVMMPSAADTLYNHLVDTKRESDYYDLILTGDLGHIGKEILVDMMKTHGYNVKSNYNDCGVLIFDKATQDTHSGGSGCACCGTVFSGYVFKQLQEKKVKRVLLIATGALMNSTSSQQGESIPGIAHAISIEL